VDRSVTYGSETSQPLPEHGAGAGMLQQRSASWVCGCRLSGKQASLFQLLETHLASNRDIQIQTSISKSISHI